MAVVNLSQSAVSPQGSKAKRMFASSGLPFGMVLLVVTLIGWGGLRWYMHTLDQKIAVLDSSLATNSSRLTGSSIDRVADFGARIMYVGSDPAEFVDPQVIFKTLESLVVPQVVLTAYQYDESTGTSTVAGETNNFRYLAEQIMSLKSDPFFVQVRVTGIERDEEGRVIFRLSVKH